MRKLLPLLTICLILIGLAGSTFIPQTHATFFIVQGTHIAFHAQADLILGVDFTFNVDTITYGNGSINIGDRWLNSTCDMTLTAYFDDGWFNYTIMEPGTQQVYVSTKPTTVYIDGSQKTEGFGWTFTSGITTINAATASASIFWESLSAYSSASSSDSTNYTMIMQILETNYSASYYAIQKIAEYDLGNTIMLTQNSIETEGWSLTDMERLIAYANSLGKYIILVPYNYTSWTGAATNSLFVTPAQFDAWQTTYPNLYAVCFPEVYGHQIEHAGYSDNSTGTVTNQMTAEAEVYANMTKLYNITGFRAVGAKIFMQDNSLSYLTAKALNTTDTYMVKLFNSANNEVMIGQGRGMSKSWNVTSWGATIDLWGELPNGTQRCPSPNLTATEANKALYESWFYGATAFHWEQGSVYGSWTDGGMVNSGNILIDSLGNLTDYGLVVQNFYNFLKHSNSTSKVATESKIALMIGQGGYGGRGPDWGIGIMNQTAHTQAQAWVQYGLFNYFYPDISNGSGVLDAWTYVGSSLSKHFTGLPYGMVDIISIYASTDTLDDYDIIFGVGWACLNSTIVSNINTYASNGGTFLAFTTFLNTNATVPLGDLEDAHSFDGNIAWNATFGCYINNTGMIYDKAHTSVNFHQNTHFYDYFGQSYSFASQWTWQFNMSTLLNETTKVIASYDNCLYSGTGLTWTPNATIIENHLGTGYVYIINAREDSLWMPQETYGSVIGDFINRLCDYHVSALEELRYFSENCLLHYNQTGIYILVIHDNSTETYTLRIPLTALGSGIPESVYNLISGTTYSFISTVDGVTYLTVPLSQNDGYCFMVQMYQPPFWIPIRPAMGVAGFAIMFIMPLLIIRKAREHDWKWVLMPGFVSLVLGYCLIVGWLWP